MFGTTELVPTKPRLHLVSDEIICKNYVKYLELPIDKNLISIHSLKIGVQNELNLLAYLIKLMHYSIQLLLETMIT